MSAATATLDAPPARPAFDRYANPRVNPWVVAIVVTMATFMEILDTSIANVSLPHIAGGLGTDLNEATWVLTSYLVANAVVLPLSAFFSRVFGRKNFYMSCVALFTIASFLCGVAPSLGWLIFFRVLQGMGGGGLAPSEQAILVDTFPPAKRGGAFALYSMAIVMAPAIGPTLGGFITDNYSWRWVFFINIPVGIVSLMLTSQLIHDSPEFEQEALESRRGGKLRVDYLGILLIGLGLGCLEVVLDKGQEEDWFGSPFITAFFIVSMASLVCAVVWEWFHDDPVVDLSMLRERNFAIACGIYLLFGLIMFGSTVIIPQMLQSLYGYTATSAGEALGPGALMIVFLAPFVVKLTPKIGAGRMVGFGFFVLALSMWHFTGFSLASTYKDFVLARMLQGFGLAFLFVPASMIAYSYLPPNKNNKASSMTNLFRNQGGSFGIAFATTMFARRLQYHQNVLGTHFTAGSPEYRTFMRGLTGTLTHAGLSPLAAATRAKAMLGQVLGQQVGVLAYLDCFWLLGLISLAGVVLAMCVKKFRPARGPGGIRFVGQAARLPRDGASIATERRTDAESRAAAETRQPGRLPYKTRRGTKVASFTDAMNPARRQTVLFLLCAVVLLGAGFACGYIDCYDGFYSPESQLDRELTGMNFNSRVLYYANVGRRLECRRELVKQLREQVAYVDKLVASAPETDSSASARTSIKQARNVLNGQPLNAGTP